MTRLVSARGCGCATHAGAGVQRPRLLPATHAGAAPPRARAGPSPAHAPPAPAAAAACPCAAAMEADGAYEPGFVGIRFCQEW